MTPREQERDAALGCAVAIACSLAFVVFVALPVHVDGLELPVALEGIWQVGFLVGAFLGPVGAGLAAFVGASALVSRGPDLTRTARRLHATTLAVCVALLVAYVANASALRVWLD